MDYQMVMWQWRHVAPKRTVRKYGRLS